MPTPKEIHNEISEILVKWDMPTRQAAINEIVSLFTQSRKERDEELREKIGELPPAVTLENAAYLVGFNEAINKVLSLLKETAEETKVVIMAGEIPNLIHSLTPENNDDKGRENTTK